MATEFVRPTKQQTSLAPELVDRLTSRKALIGVVGLGYVGFPVAVSLAETGFRVIGVDADRDRTQSIGRGESYIRDVSGEQLAEVLRGGRLRATTSYRSLGKADAILISVPTPLQGGTPDLSAVEAAGAAVAKVLTPGTLVILESTTYPGTTEEVLRPLLEAGGLQAGEDFLLAFSPERIDPGNPEFDFEDIPKIVGGIDEASTQAAEALYSQVVPKVVTVSGTREGEMAKLIENIYRHVNIALVNELATYARELGVDIWESIEAAATKPFGFQAFWPGPGWGGHCIPLDPSYLSWRVRQDRLHEVKFVELAHTINAEMPRHMVERAAELLNHEGKAIQGSRILGIGAAYKGGTEDTRGSAALRVLDSLAAKGAKVAYHDPLVPEVEIAGEPSRSIPLTAKALREADIVVALVPQIDVDWDLVAGEAALVLDCCNALGKRGPNVVRF